MTTLALDPGYERLGLAVFSEQGKVIHSECFKNLPHDTRLKKVGERIESVIQKHNIHTVALETLFFSKNQKTALKVAEVRGVILYVAAKSGTEIHEYSPAEIKKQ